MKLPGQIWQKLVKIYQFVHALSISFTVLPPVLYPSDNNCIIFLSIFPLPNKLTCKTLKFIDPLKILESRAHPRN